MRSTRRLNPFQAPLTWRFDPFRSREARLAVGLIRSIRLRIIFTDDRDGPVLWGSKDKSQAQCHKSVAYCLEGIPRVSYGAQLSRPVIEVAL